MFKQFVKQWSLMVVYNVNSEKLFSSSILSDTHKLSDIISAVKEALNRYMGTHKRTYGLLKKTESR